MSNLFDETMNEVIAKGIHLTTRPVFEITDVADPWNNLKEMTQVKNGLGITGIYGTTDTTEACEMFRDEHIWPPTDDLALNAHHVNLRQYAKAKGFLRYTEEEGATVLISKKLAKTLGRDFFFVPMETCGSANFALPLHDAPSPSLNREHLPYRAYAWCETREHTAASSYVFSIAAELAEPSVCFILDRTGLTEDDKFIPVKLLTRWIPFAGNFPLLFGGSWQKPEKKSTKRTIFCHAVPTNYTYNMAVTRIDGKRVFRDAVKTAVDLLGYGTFYPQLGGYENWDRLAALMELWNDGYKNALDDGEALIEVKFRDENSEITERAKKLLQELKTGKALY